MPPQLLFVIPISRYGNHKLNLVLYVSPTLAKFFSEIVSVEEGLAKMSFIKALIFLHILLLITSHTCRNRFQKIKAETFASNRLENSEDSSDINGLYFTSGRNSSLGGHIGHLLPMINRLKQSFFKSKINRYSSLPICSSVHLLKDERMRLILITGDIHQHPGPLQFPCSVCNKSITYRQKAVKCRIAPICEEIQTDVKLLNHQFDTLKAEKSMGII